LGSDLAREDGISLEDAATIGWEMPLYQMREVAIKAIPPSIVATVPVPVADGTMGIR
jgi:hypothetical protein